MTYQLTFADTVGVSEECRDVLVLSDHVECNRLHTLIFNTYIVSQTNGVSSTRFKLNIGQSTTKKRNT